MNTRDTLPVWSYPLLLALLGITIATGDLSTFFQIAVSAETLLFIAYLTFRSRRKTAKMPAVSNLLPLFPGHLLLLFALSIVSGQNAKLIGLWMVIPAASVIYDLVSLEQRLSVSTKVSILTVLYCIIWANLFALLERVVALGREMQGPEEVKLIVAFGILAVAFLAAGVYRHMYAIKSSKE